MHVAHPIYNESMHLRAVHLIWLIAGYSVFAAEADRAIVQVMRSAANGNHVRVLQRTQVETELDLVIALAAPWPLNTGLGDGAWWSEKADLGLFLQHRDKQDLVYRITTAKG